MHQSSSHSGIFSMSITGAKLEQPLFASELAARILDPSSVIGTETSRVENSTRAKLLVRRPAIRAQEGLLLSRLRPCFPCKLMLVILRPLPSTCGSTSIRSGTRKPHPNQEQIYCLA